MNKGPEVNADGIVTMQATFDYEKAKRDELRNAQTFVKAETKIKSKEEFLCMKCSEPVGGFDHLRVGSTAGPWYCHNCGTGYLIQRTDEGVNVAQAKDNIVKTLVLLQLSQPTEKPIHIVVEGRMFLPIDKDIHEAIGEQQDKDKYYYNQHTCPSNYLDVRIAENGDPDPHGVFNHVQTVIKPDGDDRGKITTSGGFDYPDNYLGWIDIFPALQ